MPEFDFHEKYSFDEFGIQSELIKDFIAEKSELADFGQIFKSDLTEQINVRRAKPVDRACLVKVIEEQYRGLKIAEAVQNNIVALKSDETYTCATGHQLNLLTGPLFSVYKIAQIISLTKELQDQHPSVRLVPVFWMATEDHDFDEISHIHLFNQKISWQHQDTEAKVCGRIQTTGINSFIEALKSVYHDAAIQEKIDDLGRHYTARENLADATRSLINELFGAYGLVIVDGDHPELKKQFASILHLEVSDQVTEKAVGPVNQKLDQMGYHQQVYLRSCNLFYIDDRGVRLRLDPSEKGFIAGDREFSREELKALIHEQPDRFSPNALLRPIYQETILPNLLYLGGGGELAYWLQLGDLFRKLELPLPMLKLRDSVLVLTERQNHKLKDLHLKPYELKDDVHTLVKRLVLADPDKDLQLTDAEAQLFRLKSMVMEKVMKADPGMQGMVEAEFVRIMKSLEKIESKLIKAEKAKQSGTIAVLEGLQQKIFPGQKMQERHDNFVPYYLRDESWIDKLMTIYSIKDKPLVRLMIH